MNILVIGNGFDLAHGLPTKYEDFLEFIKIIKQCFEQDNFKSKEIDWGNWHMVQICLLQIRVRQEINCFQKNRSGKI